MTLLNARKIYKYKKGGNSVVFCGSVYILDTTPACINTKPLWLDGLKYSCRRCCLNILKRHDYTGRGVSPQITRSHVSCRTLQEQTALRFQVMSLSERAHFFRADETALDSARSDHLDEQTLVDHVRCFPPPRRGSHLLVILLEEVEFLLQAVQVSSQRGDDLVVVGLCPPQSLAVSLHRLAQGGLRLPSAEDRKRMRVQAESLQAD